MDSVYCYLSLTSYPASNHSLCDICCLDDRIPECKVLLLLIINREEITSPLHFKLTLATNAKFSSISYCSLENPVPYVYLFDLIACIMPDPFFISGKITAALVVVLVVPILVVNCKQFRSLKID